MSGTTMSPAAAGGLRAVLNFQRIGAQRYVDSAGFPGRWGSRWRKPRYGRASAQPIVLFVMAGHSRSKNGVASFAYGPGHLVQDGTAFTIGVTGIRPVTTEE